MYSLTTKHYEAIHVILELAIIIFQFFPSPVKYVILDITPFALTGFTYSARYRSQSQFYYNWR